MEMCLTRSKEMVCMIMTRSNNMEDMFMKE